MGRCWFMLVEVLQGCHCSATLRSCWHCQPSVPCPTTIPQVLLLCSPVTHLGLPGDVGFGPQPI